MNYRFALTFYPKNKTELAKFEKKIGRAIFKNLKTNEVDLNYFK